MKFITFLFFCDIHKSKHIHKKIEPKFKENMLIPKRFLIMDQYGTSICFDLQFGIDLDKNTCFMEKVIETPNTFAPN